MASWPEVVRANVSGPASKADATFAALADDGQAAAVDRDALAQRDFGGQGGTVDH